MKRGGGRVKYYTQQRIRNKYAKDKSIYAITPQAVVFPTTEQDIIDVLHYAKNHTLSVTPRGGGTGLSGAAVGNGIVLDCSKHLTKITTLGTLTTVQAGILLKKLRPQLEQQGYMLPSVPLHGDCAIGGNINTRSVGPRTIQYGTIDKHIVSLRGILSDGRILDTRKIIPQDIAKKVIALQKTIKKDKQLVAYLKQRPLTAGGYNLNAFLDYRNVNDIIAHLIAGSTGTLMVLTEVQLRLPKFKPLKQVSLLHFSSYDNMQHAMNKIFKMHPGTIEYAGEKCLHTWHTRYQHNDSVGALIVGFEKTTSLKKIQRYTLSIEHILVSRRKHLWTSRQLALPKLEQQAKKLGVHLPPGIDDMTFHPQYFSRIMHDLKTYTQTHKIHIATFGHIGVGSLHLRPFINLKKHPKQLDTLGKDIFKIARKYGGTLVGEHDAGRCRSRYLPMESKKMYATMKKVKNIFDPENILNPDIVFNLKPITTYISP